MSLLNQPEVAGQFESEDETNGAATEAQTTAAPTAEAVAAPKAEPQVRQ